MVVRKRGNNWYVDARVDLGAGRRERFRRSLGPLPGRVEAEAAATELLRDLESQMSGHRRAAFSGFAAHWLEQRTPSLRPTTATAYEQILRVHLVPFFGHRDLRTIEAWDIEAFRAQKLATHAPKTVHNQMGLLSSLFKAAVRWGYTEVDPTVSVSLPRLTGPEMQFWDADQSRSFLEACAVEDPEFGPFFLTALRAGLRLGELFGLQVRHVLGAAGHLDIRRAIVRGEVGPPKHGKVRQVPMTPELYAVLARRVDGRGPDALVFAGPDGAPLTRDRVKRPFWRATERAGLPRIRLHDLRHSYASQLVLAGVPLPVVQRLLGHSDIRTTMRYAHLAPSGLASFVEVLDGPRLREVG